MAGKVSKNQRTAKKPAVAASHLAGDARVIVSCNGGKNAYVRGVDGKAPNLRTDSVQFEDALRSLAQAGHAGKVARELDELAAASSQWSTVAARVRNAGILAS